MRKFRSHFYYMADKNRLEKANSADIDSDSITTAPAYRAGVARLINPFHDRATMYLATEIDVCRFCKKP
jgi:hypothetical protein